MGFEFVWARLDSVPSVVALIEVGGHAYTLLLCMESSTPPRDTAWAMSEENVEIVRRSFEIWKSRDLSDVSHLTHPAFVLDLSRNIFNPDLFRGTDGIRLFFERVDEMWDELEVNAEEIIDGDDRLVVASRLKGVGRDGVKANMLVFQVWEFREGKVVRLTGGFRERGEALKAAGLSE